MEIKILGNGGAINNGLFYNSFIIDNNILCETPPDIMITLNKQSVEIDKIKSIFISHFHGDHCFGLPFLILNLFYKNVNKQFNKINIYGPKDMDYKAKELLILAFTKDHPCFAWMNNNCNFYEIGNKKINLNNYKFEFYTLKHIVPTYGFVLYDESDVCLFSYIPDTIWTENIDHILNKKPKIVIIDLNGKKEDKHKVHISIEDLLNKGIKITEENTIYYGTHLKEEFESSHNNIKCCYVGNKITI